MRPNDSDFDVAFTINTAFCVVFGSAFVGMAAFGDRVINAILSLLGQ